jgi:hypothetical protein
MEPRKFLLSSHGRGFYLSATQMFQFPSLVAMSIAATRMYRSLSDFVFGSTDMYYFLRLPSSLALTAIDDSVASPTLFRKDII